MSANRLGGEKSPYLLQHKNNPVAWQPWGEEAFGEAKAQDKPVFLSIGYSTCHWCHVMAHESFENEEIAAALNRDFISIKVDREERPDVDRLYMAFVQATTGSGGWPMSVWLTPEGRPFFGGTYFPPADRYGRVGFPNLLGQIARVWREDREGIERESRRVMATLGTVAAEEGGELPGRWALEKGFQAFARNFDEHLGGFGRAPKFPRPSVFNFLLRYDAGGEAGAMALFTLQRMAAGGMRDHLGGGFHRYSVDEFWHVPHFEKMLYDQAQLAVSYVEAWQVTHEERYAAVARETLDYVLRDLRHEGGGFYSAEDADSVVTHGSAEHAEGAFYVWTREEIKALLGPEDAEIFGRHYGVEEEGNAPEGSDPQGEFTGKNILIERQEVAETARLLGKDVEAVAGALERGRTALLEARAKRPRPHLDDKILTAWNGLMISALAKAGAALGEERYLEAARGAARFIRRELYADGRLLRTWREGPGTIRGFAEDYAFLIQGLLDLYEATFESDWLEWAFALQERQEELFGDETGYFGSEGGDPLVAVRLKEDYDGAEPAANSVSALNLLRLGRMAHDEGLEARARGIITAQAQVIGKAPTAVPQMLVALDLALAAPAQAVVAGAEGDAAVQRWNRWLHRDFQPRRVLVLADGERFPAARNPLLAEMKPVGERAALYVCKDFACQAPRTEIG